MAAGQKLVTWHAPHRLARPTQRAHLHRRGRRLDGSAGQWPRSAA